MKLVKNVKKEQFYKTYLQILNGLLHLTPKETDILSEILTEYDKLSHTGLSNQDKESIVLSKAGRKKLQKKLNIGQHNLNNYIKTLRDRGLINNKTLLIPLKNTEIIFKLELKEQADDNGLETHSNVRKVDTFF